MYFSGQGRILVAAVVNGVPGAFAFIGNVPNFTFNLETDTLEHKESTSGARVTDVRIDREKRTRLQATMEDASSKNLARVLFGEVTAIGSATVTNEAGPSGLAVGDFWRLSKVDVSAVVVRDSTGSPKTLTANTNYRVASAKHGTIEILDLTAGGPYVQPLKADYSAGAAESVAMFTTGRPELWVRFEGINTADANKPVLVEFYKVALDPLKEFGLISDDIAQFELAGSALLDSTKASDPVLGQFGRFVHID